MRLGKCGHEYLRRLAVSTLAASVISFALLPLAGASAFSGIIIDAKTGMPVVDALVALGGRSVRTDAAGAFAVDGNTKVMRIRAYGYLRTQRGDSCSAFEAFGDLAAAVCAARDFCFAVRLHRPRPAR